MNFINYAVLLVTFFTSLPSHSESIPSSQAPILKTPLQICAEKKLKDFRVRNLVSKADEPLFLEKFKQECSKEKNSASINQQLIDAASRAEQERKKNAAVTTPAKPASADQSSAANSGVKPVVGPTASGGSSTSSAGSGQAVFGGCGNAEQCAATMAEANREKFVWSAPGLQAYLGELWGNNLNTWSFGSTFEQPDSPCSDKNKGEIIALDMGTELKPIACMSNQASQEEIKKMAEKIKNVKVDTLPTIVAIKKPQYKWITLEPYPPLEENEIRICTPVGESACHSGTVGNIEKSQPKCGVYKCVRTDTGGPVKTVKKDEKKDDGSKSEPIANSQTTQPREPAQQQQQTPPQQYQGFDAQRDGAAGP
ncbi:hypothetical protein K2P97_02295 [bacterium]|nr:hypothetical protein [bacterium]